MFRRTFLAASLLAVTAAMGFAQAPPMPPLYASPAARGFSDPIYAVPPAPVMPVSQSYSGPAYGMQPTAIPAPMPQVPGFRDPIYAVPPMPSNQSFARDAIFSSQPVFQQDQGLPPDGGMYQPWPPPDTPVERLWKGSIEGGLNGAAGNSELLNARLFWTADRKTDTNLFHADMIYLLGKDEGTSIQDTVIINLRDEHLIAGSPWSYFASSFIDYDELRDYKTILGLFAGLGYLVADTDRQFLKLRFGAGAIYKTSGSDVPGDVWEAALDFGYDYKIKFGERSAFISSLDYYPSLDKGFGEYLLRFKVAYECTIDPKSGLFFRVGVFERYDSNPGFGYNKSDFNYYTAMGFNF